MRENLALRIVSFRYHENNTVSLYTAYHPDRTLEGG